MAPGRYELSEAQWQRITDTLPGRAEHVGRTAADNRLFVNAVLWFLRSGARWHDLPEHYGKYKSVHARFMRWAVVCVGAYLRRPGPGQEELLPDARFHHRAGPTADRCGTQKGRSEDPALGRSRGGLSTKIHLLVDENGLPVAFRITAGQAAEYQQAMLLLEGQTASAVIADKGYGSAEIVAKIESLGAVAVIPPRRHRLVKRCYDREFYKQRNGIERCFNALKHFRRFSTRYCRTVEAFRSTTAIACSWIRLQLYVDTA